MLIVLTLTVTGCRSNRYMHGDSNPNRSADNNPAGINQPTIGDFTQSPNTLLHTDYHQYSANFSCTIDDVRVNGQIRMVYDSIIWVSISKIVELGRVVLTPTHAQGYVNIANKYFDGDYYDIAKKWGIEIDFGTLQALLTGDLPPRCTLQQEPQNNSDIATLLYDQYADSPEHPKQVTIIKDMSLNRASETTVKCHSLNQNIRCSYSMQSDINGHLTPSVIGVVVNSKQTNITTQIKLEKIQINPPLTFPFKIPNNYKEL